MIFEQQFVNFNIAGNKNSNDRIMHWYAATLADIYKVPLLANFEVLDISFFFNKLKEIGTTKRLSKTASEKNEVERSYGRLKFSPKDLGGPGKMI